MQQEKAGQYHKQNSFIRITKDLSLIGAPLFFLISEIIHPVSYSDTATELSSVASHHIQWYIAHVAALLALIMIPSAIHSLLKLLESRFPMLSRIGAAFISTGIVALSGLLAFDIVTWVMVDAGTSGAIAELYDRITMSSGFSLIFLTFGPLSLVIGMLLLAILLFISGTVKWWQSAGFGVGIFLYGFAGPVFAVSGGVLIVITGAVLMLAGLGSIGLLDLFKPKTSYII